MLKMVLLDTEKLPYPQSVELQESLKHLGELSSYVTTTPDELVSRCQDAQVILVNKNLIQREHFKALPNLRYVIVIATGYNNVDVIAAQEFGINVSNLPTYSAPIVAQHTLALLLELTNQVGKVSHMVQYEGKWGGTKHKHLELAGLTIGIVGFGNIAKRVINLALALNMNVVVHRRRENTATDLPLNFVSKEELLCKSDVITLHCPLTAETQEFINAESLSQMKPGCLLINTARGGLVNEADLYAALLNKQIKGAALDVLNQEPPAPDNPLLQLDNCIITPHNAWVSPATLQRWKDDTLACVNNYLAGRFINLVY